MSAAAPLSCIIVDDNTMNRLTLEQFVRITAGLEVQASLADPVALLPLLEQDPMPQLLLLDIEMPQLSGLELVRLLPSPGPEVVLITSHAQFAVDAFALRVTDYLLKPLEYARFLQAVARVRERLASRPAPPQPDLDADDTSLFIRTNNKLVRLDFDQVLYIEAMSAYCVLVTATRKHIVHATLKAIDEQLPFAHFLRVHRSYMVNTRLIDSVADGHLQLGSFEIPIGKSYEQALIARLRSL